MSMCSYHDLREKTKLIWILCFSCQFLGLEQCGYLVRKHVSTYLVRVSKMWTTN